MATYLKVVWQVSKPMAKARGGGESTRGGIPLLEGGFGESPPRKSLLYMVASMCDFYAFWMRIGPEFQPS